MQTQEIQNVKLVLKSEEGIKPLQQYAGTGFLTVNSSGFHFVERQRYKRVKNIRLAKLSEGTFMMYMQKEGDYKIELRLSSDELTVKSATKKVSALLKEARESGMLL